MTAALKAPFPYFGGKASVAGPVWERLGDVDNYVEPFAGSLAVLLSRPTAPRIETVNDADAYLANFWRAVSYNPEGVVDFANWPVNEADLHARHRWLLTSDRAVDMRTRVAADPEYYDAQIAGWWAWGICCWIGAGWCAAQSEKLPRLTGARRGDHYYGGLGVHQDLPQGRPQLADAYDIGRGVHSRGDLGSCEQRRAWLLDWFSRLQDRLRTVRVCCGDWKRVCGSRSVTTRLGTTGVFLDPPYAKDLARLAELIDPTSTTSSSTSANRHGALYGNDTTQDVDSLVADVHAWCREQTDNADMRIALAGYEGEHDALERLGWSVVAWKTNGGYGNRSGNANRHRERLWFSPACCDPARMLF